MDMKIPKCNGKAAVIHVIEPLAGLDDVAVSVKAIAVVGKAVFCLELRPVCSEPPVECQLGEKIRRSIDRFHPAHRHREVQTCEQPHGFSANQMQSQFRYQTAGSEHQCGVDPEESSTEPIPDERNKLESDRIY